MLFQQILLFTLLKRFWLSRSLFKLIKSKIEMNVIIILFIQ